MRLLGYLKMLNTAWTQLPAGSARLARMALIGFAIVVGLAALTRPSVAPADTAPADTAPPAASNAGVSPQDLFTQKCSACHDLPDPKAKGFTRDEWQDTVDEMLTTYGASNSISPDQATTIVTYLATFAPHLPTGPRSPWSSENSDIVPVPPVSTSVVPFVAGRPLGSLAQWVGGDSAPPARWSVLADRDAPSGSDLHFSRAGADGGAFALLNNPAAAGGNVEVHLRFALLDGHKSPAAGIAFGVRDAKDYDVVCFDPLDDSLTLMHIAGSQHDILQRTTLTIDAPGSETLVDPNERLGTVHTYPQVPFPTDFHLWHTLRILATDERVRAWIDGNKRINTVDPNYTPGSVALWVQGDAGVAFDDWITDVYPDSTAPATGPAPPPM